MKLRTHVGRLLGAALVLLWARTSLAGASARLVYVRGSSAEDCPSETAIRAAVRARLGYDPFFPWAHDTMYVEASRSEGTIRIQVKLVGEDNSLRGARDLSFYYGTDLPCPMKNWQILGADAAGLEGDINVAFVPPTPGGSGLEDAGPDTDANGVVGSVDDDGSAEDATTAGGDGDASPLASCYLPGWQGQFHAMTFDTNGSRLRFTFGTGEDQGSYPISYDLWRVCGE
jgi:hypothetical protein